MVLTRPLNKARFLKEIIYPFELIERFLDRASSPHVVSQLQAISDERQ